MANYYQPSGKYSPSAFIYFLIIALIALPILGLIYAYAIWYIPLIYVNFIIAGGFGFAVGWLINKFVIGRGKVRNTKLAILFGVLSGLIALYFHWAVWMDLVLNAGESIGSERIGITVSNIKILQVFSLATNPSSLFELIGLVNETGTWGIRGGTVSGTFLSVIWIIELLIVVIVATLIPIGTSREPFCEIDNNWFSKTILPAFNVIADKSQMKTALENSQPQVFDDITKVENTDQHHSIFTLYTSEKGENYLSIENKIAQQKDDGKIEFKDDQVVEYISISKSLVDALNGK